MREAWRWFGPNDPVTIQDIRQTGATDVVSALHTIAAGETWPLEKISAHQQLIEQDNKPHSSLVWSVVESIPVHEDIKLGRENHQRYVDSWIASMENLAKCGIKTICYNFMPVIDWTRTDLKFKLSNGAYALRFDQQKFSAFDLFILKRENAEADYSEKEVVQAKATFYAMSAEDKALLTQNIIAGLPGKMTDAYTIDNFRDMLANYKDINKDVLRKNLFSFLSQVLPKAEQLGVKLAIHPDDPPRDMLGLPRIICTSEDLELLFSSLPSPANGITLCAGTYGSRPDNDLPAMAKQYGSRIHFAHLRGVSRDKDEQRSFYEAEHLGSDVDMVGVISALLKEEKLRTETEDNREIFIRPDHGHQILDDINKKGNPGYSCIGRLKGLAEIRGVIKALAASL
ncbi:MAG: mannonate dehydratase [Colwellia sp.]|nr:mannonate dehydratase [Colwellia sp.]